MEKESQQRGGSSQDLPEVHTSELGEGAGMTVFKNLFPILYLGNNTEFFQLHTLCPGI